MLQSKPQPPIDPYCQAWLERRMSWLAQVFGLERLCQATVVLPTPEFFPDHWSASDADVRAILDRVCRHMAVEPSRLRLELFDDDEGIEPLGVYVQGPPERILVNRSELTEVESLVATLAHELGHVLLLGDRRIASEVADHESLTDLATVFFGLGVFSSNTAIRDRYERGKLEGARGYLVEPVLAYALALFAWARQENHPSWRQFLRPNVAAALDRSLRYLQETGATLFPEGASDPPNVAAALSALQSATASVRISALWDLQELHCGDAPALAAIEAVLKDPEPLVRQEAALTLASLGPAAITALPNLMRFVQDERHVDARAAGIQALGWIRGQADASVPLLIRVIKDEANVRLQVEAVRALGRFETAAAAAAPLLVQAAGRKPEVAVEAMDALLAIGPAAANVAPELIELLADGDAAMFWHHAVNILQRVGFDHADVLPALLATLKDRKKGPSARGAAAWALSDAPSLPAQALTALADAARSKDRWIRLCATCGLAVPSGDVRPALELLHAAQPVPLGSAITDTEHDSYQLAIDFVRRTAEPATAVLSEWLGEPTRQVFAAWALFQAGPAAAPALPALHAALSANPNRVFRLLLSAALWRSDQQVATAAIVQVWKESLPSPMSGPVDLVFETWIPATLSLMDAGIVQPLLEAAVDKPPVLRDELTSLLGAMAGKSAEVRACLGQVTGTLAVCQWAKQILDRHVESSQRNRLRRGSLPPVWSDTDQEGLLEEAVLDLLEHLIYLAAEEREKTSTSPPSSPRSKRG